MPFWKDKIKPDGAGYYEVLAISDLIDNKISSVLVNGQTILITKLDEQIRAFSAQCPHASGNLAKGSYYRGRIDCPEHEYRFDVRTGRAIWPEDELCRLRFFEVLVDDRRVKVKL